MTALNLDINAPDLTAEDYVVIGLATCFIRAEGEIHAVKIMEPIPSAALESLMQGIPTSYEKLWGTTLGQVLVDATPQIPADFPTETQVCDDFVERAIAATRTYKRRSEATTLIPVETHYTELNFSLERKRVLNSERIIRTEDNVKQHEYTHKVL